MLEYLPKRRRVGGIRVDAHKSESTRAPIRSGFVPARLFVPLEPHNGQLPEPLVEAGQHVLKGETLAAGRPGSSVADVHASSSGTVVAIQTIERQTSRGAERLSCIVLETDGRDEATTSDRGADRPEATAPQLVELIRKSGIVGLGGAAVPTGWKLERSAALRTLIINGAECEPWISCDDMLMREHPQEIIAGALALCDVIGAEQCFFAIERDKPQAIQAIRAAAQRIDDPRMRLAELPSIYPAGGERQLIELLVGREVPSGCFPADIGILCQNVATALAVHHAFSAGQPLVSRVVTITGGGILEPCNIEVRIGTMISDLIAHCGGYVDDPSALIIGGSMMGIAQVSDEIPVGKGTNCILVADKREAPVTPAEWPCIRCGECAGACPARLLPQDLLRAAESADFSQLESLGLDDCIECGCCDAICPSHIRLTGRFVAARRAQRRRREAKNFAAASQERFDAHSQRLAAIEEREREEQNTLRAGLQTEEDRKRAIRAALERARGRRGDGPS